MSQFGAFFFVGGSGGMHSVGGNFSGTADKDIWQPAADLIEIDGGFLVQVDLPGVDADSVEAVIDGQHLHIRGVRRAMYPRRSKRYIHMEVSRGEFGKVIVLPAPVSEENCQARLQNGVLEIVLPHGGRPVLSVVHLRIRSMG